MAQLKYDFWLDTAKVQQMVTKALTTPKYRTNGKGEKVQSKAFHLGGGFFKFFTKGKLSSHPHFAYKTSNRLTHTHIHTHLLDQKWKRRRTFNSHCT